MSSFFFITNFTYLVIYTNTAIFVSNYTQIRKCSQLEINVFRERTYGILGNVKKRNNGVFVRSRVSRQVGSVPLDKSGRQKSVDRHFDVDSGRKRLLARDQVPQVVLKSEIAISKCFKLPSLRNYISARPRARVSRSLHFTRVISHL